MGELGLDEDYLVWDETEHVTVTAVRRDSPNETAEVYHAKRHEVGFREAAASGGANVIGDVIFHIVAAELDFDLKPGDTIEDEDGTTFTILAPNYQRPTRTWRPACRDLILAFDLRDTITIERPKISTSIGGAVIRDWEVAYVNLSAKVQRLGGNIIDERGLRGMSVPYEIPVYPQVEITNEYRIVWPASKTGYLEIRGFRNPDRIDELMVIDAEEVP